MARARRRLQALSGGKHAYIVGRKLGAGGVGVVYDGLCPATGAQVAIKLLHAAHRRDDDLRRRFVDEAIAGRIVASPRVIRVLDHGCTPEGDPFVVMERSYGEPLGVRIQREGPFALERAIAITREILAGLAAVHDLGIVHADVKSDNVLVETTLEGDVVKLIDFGLARVQLGSTTSPPDEHAQWLSGTPEYMAPEVIRGEGVAFASDLYAAGVILYELLTGTTPFAGGSSVEVMSRHLDDEVVPPSVRAEQDVPAFVDDVVLCALEKDPARRHRDARAFIHALELAVARPQRTHRTTTARFRVPRARTDATTIVDRPALR